MAAKIRRRLRPSDGKAPKNAFFDVLKGVQGCVTRPANQSTPTIPNTDKPPQPHQKPKPTPRIWRDFKGLSDVASQSKIGSAPGWRRPGSLPRSPRRQRLQAEMRSRTPRLGEPIGEGTPHATDAFEPATSEV